MSNEAANIIIDRVIDLLNSAIACDKNAITNLFEMRVECNEDLANHPEVQAHKNGESEGFCIGVLGLISGISGTRMHKGNPTFSNIWARYDDDGKVICVERVPEEAAAVEGSTTK